MSGRALHAELAAVRALVAGARAGITETEDTGQVWIRTACARLNALDGLLAEAAGVPAAPVRVAALTVMTFLVVAGPAALATAMGLGGAGVLVASGLALVIGAAAMPSAGCRVFALVGRRRLALTPRPAALAPEPADAPELASPPRPPNPPDLANPPTSTDPPRPTDIPDLANPPTPADVPGLADVPDALLHARVRLVSAALRHVGADSWTAPQLRRAIRTDPVTRRLAHADQLLCQAIDCVERCLGDRRKDLL
ncbi:hypothetical protein QLQ12_31680 [Actinoplanes sp. NEAU-A12]|uniref:Uncharacterized protein n=1 Tax=Actinoplanes sandaracinus TaxID=3045177 RepID=A0ABT6WTV5_9ACTN|nr:hypothetical protein [Actinoplanes sandaracinus]MDI6103178.1 hypothetical protein [Actinoplanes sandaracinus]